VESKSSRRDRHSLRLAAYDYAEIGAYYVTMVTHQRACLFGRILNEEVILNAAGEVAQLTWNELPAHFPGIALDVFIVMPNHIHGIIHITEKRPQSVGAQHAAPLPTAGSPQPHVQCGSLGAIVRSFKSAVTKRYNERHPGLRIALWQRNYYEHVIRNEPSLIRIRDYIATNPARWSIDPENPFATERESKDIWRLDGNSTAVAVGAQHAAPLPGISRT
jgi:REP-associated tyrosine transposase